ncbi:MAG: dienelactone hydrolase family protein [Burkholderiales bacterium]|jgi:pimeloyl-ACP methyl ester carboxylesterase|nr:dienelactone hydrolase family protein [Burkholderiales bacterium]MCA3226394.1 dienelactone hydrolase family protein [Burkholderiales bacterium]MCE2645796.1 dienelactone hydrolase family protein [Burkholderiaceae bacterium]
MRSHEVRVGPQRLPGSLDVPLQPRALILFAHGSGSSRHSPRNRQVAQVLHGCDLATLRFDLLTEDEADARSNVFDIPLLAGRLLQALEWQRGQPSLSALPCGLFGASTGAAAALAAAAEEATAVYAVVSRGGRPDLAGAALPRVVAPTLLVVGGNDPEVLRLNRAALSALRCECELAVVPGATHLFEEPGTLEAAARLAADWFVAHLPV